MLLKPSSFISNWWVIWPLPHTTGVSFQPRSQTWTDCRLCKPSKPRLQALSVTFHFSQDILLTIEISRRSWCSVQFYFEHHDKCFISSVCSLPVATLQERLIQGFPNWSAFSSTCLSLNGMDWKYLMQVSCSSSIMAVTKGGKMPPRPIIRVIYRSF